MPWLGVYVTAITKPLARYYALPIDQGALIIKVVPYSPAYKAGLRPGDIIVSIDGTPVKTAEDLSSAIRLHRIGDVVSIEFWRGKTSYKVKVELEAPPSIF